MLQAGLKRKAELEAKAKADHQRWAAELDRLNSARPGLEAALQRAKSGAEAEKPRGGAAAGGCAAELRELAVLRETVRTQQEEMRLLRRDIDALRKALGKEGGASTAAADTEAAPVVSEYAKWMDGAGDGSGVADQAPPESAGKDEDEGEDGRPPPYRQEDAADPEDARAEASDPAEGWLWSLRAGIGRIFTKLSGGSAVDQAQQKLDSNRHEAAELTKKLERLKHADADHSGFASLAGTCLEKKDSQYTYELCFFDSANQGTVVLGQWSGWVGPREARFEGGDECWGGPARSLRVLFRCGSGEEVHEVTEPSRCSYEVHISHPGACDPGDEAALLAPPVRRPRDEF
ncbi:unnamed protein product [Prorocentrum cordatum]|uniref:MRH domain-containing protein n=1 Tax=Prorocentrum cordatum TaxID=2364126 RepID=A0ABN9TGG8_9DINO|nr:unnamed protein product [Polarella glacialis]